MNPVIETSLYRERLQSFVNINRLPARWFNHPDHIAFKSADADGYNELIEQFRPQSEHIYEAWIDDRRLAAAKLLGTVSIDMGMAGTYSDGRVDWVEIMEPRPEKVGQDFVGLEHSEFVSPIGIEPVRSVLENKLSQWAIESNESHRWISVKINDDGQELKITDTPLATIVAEQLKSHRQRIKILK